MSSVVPSLTTVRPVLPGCEAGLTSSLLQADVLHSLSLFSVKLTCSSPEDHVLPEATDFSYTFVCNVISLLFNTLSRFVMAFLPRNTCLLISWLQSLSAVILEPKKRKSAIFTFPQWIFYEMMGPNDMIFVF